MLWVEIVIIDLYVLWCLNKIACLLTYSVSSLEYEGNEKVDLFVAHMVVA